MRIRTCEGPGQHVFETTESSRPEVKLSTYRVVEGHRHFDHTWLTMDVTYTLSGVLNALQIAEVVEATEQLLWARIDARREDRQGPIRKREIATHVASALQQMAASSLRGPREARELRRAHVLWGLARGTDAGGRLEGPIQVLEWLKKTYPREVDPQDVRYKSARHYARPRIDRWHPLKADAAPQPSRVVFLVRSGETEPYDFEHVWRTYDHPRLVNSVARALAGAPDHERVSNYVVQWCLWTLAGQSVVRSADLAAMITHCLRKVDEIGYLSWIIRVRDLEATEVWEEALGLVAWPSPRLVFDPEAAQDPNRQRNWEQHRSEEGTVDPLPWVVPDDPHSDTEQEPENP